MIWEILKLSFLTGLVAGTCYPPYGCFNNKYPFNHTLIIIPEAPEVLRPAYHLQTRTGNLKFSGASCFEILCKMQAMLRLIGDKPVKFIIHGLLENTKKSWLGEMSKALLKLEDAAIFIVDWERGANTFLAPGNARIVGAQIAFIIEHLVRLGGGSATNYHMIGFSLGAHVAGYCGKKLQKHGMMLGRISGLDVGDLPRGFIYETADSAARLHYTDAKFVDVIHSDMDGFGIDKPIGHLDFYPNGGKKQPGCRWTLKLFKESSFDLARSFACDHIRSVHFYIESIKNRECRFQSFLCPTEESFTSGKCHNCTAKNCPEMGYYADNTPDYSKFMGKKLYLHTHKSSPFCINKKTKTSKEKEETKKKKKKFNWLDPSTWFTGWGLET